MIAFREEIGGGAQGIVEAVAKFGNILNHDTFYAAAVMLLTNVGYKMFDFVSNIRKLSVINIMLSLTSELREYSFFKIYLATWFASVDVSDDKQISRTELFKFMKKTIKGNTYSM